MYIAWSILRDQVLEEADSLDASPRLSQLVGHHGLAFLHAKDIHSLADFAYGWDTSEVYGGKAVMSGSIYMQWQIAWPMSLLKRVASCNS